MMYWTHTWVTSFNFVLDLESSSMNVQRMDQIKLRWDLVDIIILCV